MGQDKDDTQGSLEATHWSEMHAWTWQVGMLQTEHNPMTLLAWFAFANRVSIRSWHLGMERGFAFLFRLGFWLLLQTSKMYLTDVVPHMVMAAWTMT